MALSTEIAQLDATAQAELVRHKELKTHRTGGSGYRAHRKSEPETKCGDNTTV